MKASTQAIGNDQASGVDQKGMNEDLLNNYKDFFSKSFVESIKDF